MDETHLEARVEHLEARVEHLEGALRRTIAAVDDLAGAVGPSVARDAAVTLHRARTALRELAGSD